MSETKNNKIWADGIKSMKLKKLEFGNILSVGIDVDTFIAFLQKHKNDRGYVNLNIQARKEVGQYGDTHNCSLDTWVPKNQTQHKPQQAAQPAKKVAKPSPQPQPQPQPQQEPDDNQF